MGMELRIRHLITAFVFLIILLCVFWVWQSPMTSHSARLHSIYYSSTDLGNISIPKVLNASASERFADFDIVNHEQNLTKNQEILIDDFLRISEISNDSSFILLVTNDQLIDHKGTELQNRFIFILVKSENETIRFVSGMKTLWGRKWGRKNPNFTEQKNLSHQRASEKTQEILEVLNIPLPDEIVFQEYYIL